MRETELTVATLTRTMAAMSGRIAAILKTAVFTVLSGLSALACCKEIQDSYQVIALAMT
jgi:hypothetical protein